jgi:hypothetical protein
MATTTNYGWDTPDDTDLVKDGAAAIRTLGSSIDTTTKNLNPQTTTGAIAYRSATANVNTALPIGTTGQVLTVAAGVPSWAAPAGGGKVLQVVQGTTTTRMQTTSTTYVDTNLSQAITPSSATSKVLVLVFQNIHLSRSGTDAACQYKLVRTSTALSEYYLSMYNSTGGDAEIRQMGVFSYLDSPATTSATTYKTQIRSGNASTTSDVQENASSLAAIVLLEIGA